MRKAFTLIELLVVIAILAVLAVVVVLTLNPAGLLQEGRDSSRVSDMATLNTGISLYTADATVASLGSANTVYVSVPDPTATSTAGDQCQGLGLISLPAGWSYQCAASSTFRKTDGTGWIPANLSQASFGTPLSMLPIDPTNTSSSRRYYAYATDGNGHFEVTSVMESAKYQLGGSGDVISGDGGTLASVYEKGSKLGLEPLDYGDPSLVGLWTFDEGTGSTTYDYSGSNATGSWNGTPAGTSGYYSAGKIGGWAGTFDGSSTYASVPYKPVGQSQVTVSMWEWFSSTHNTYPEAFGCVGSIYFGPGTGAVGKSDLHVYGATSGVMSVASPSNQPTDSWHFIVGTYDGTYGRMYVDGSPVFTSSAQPI